MITVLLKNKSFFPLINLISSEVILLNSDDLHYINYHKILKPYVNHLIKRNTYQIIFKLKLKS